MLGVKVMLLLIALGFMAVAAMKKRPSGVAVLCLWLVLALHIWPN